jgi:hypothetical protein
VGFCWVFQFFLYSFFFFSFLGSILVFTSEISIPILGVPILWNNFAGLISLHVKCNGSLERHSWGGEE